MAPLSRNILSVLLHFSVLFSKPSWKKALTLLLGTLLCTGKRTICSALRAMGLEYEPGCSKYHHLLNRAEWSSLKAAKILFQLLLVFVSDKLPLEMDKSDDFASASVGGENLAFNPRWRWGICGRAIGFRLHFFWSGSCVPPEDECSLV